MAMMMHAAESDVRGESDVSDHGRIKACTPNLDFERGEMMREQLHGVR